jgi:CRISPR-associated protein Cmr1
MSRKLPEAPQWNPPDLPLQTLSLDLKVITPMFGGGYEPREVDEIAPIRPAAIRGHLRFWWRAIYGGQYPTAEKLFCEESKRWGSTEKPGSIRLHVQVTNIGISKPHSQIAPRPSPKQGPCEGFFLFPFQAQRNEGLPEANAQENIRFRLIVLCPADFENEVRNTLRAWIVLGGVGARTRRGCGALSVEEHPDVWLPPIKDTERQQWFRALITSADAAQTSLLAGGSVVWGKPDADAQRVWSELGRFWSAFRKGHVGSETYSPMSGSKWRDYQTLTRWERERGQASLPLAKPFLGLPIIFQNFKNGKFAGTIEATSSGRMASPVILKPMALQNGEVCPLVAVLRAPSPDKIRIGDTTVSIQNPSNDPVLKDLSARDPLEAVIKAAERQWSTRSIKLEALP